MNKPERRTADKIRAEIRNGNVCMVGKVTTETGVDYSNLGFGRAARLIGTYVVTQGAYETVVDLNSQRLE